MIFDEQFDVIVTNNMFGDIITDLAAGLQGGLGMAASANSVRGVLTRPESFSNTTHAPDLVSRAVHALRRLPDPRQPPWPQRRCAG